MLKKTITFTNFDDQQVTEDHFFHISKAELVEMELSMEGGLSKHLEKIVEDGNGKTIMETFKKLILDAYGKKSPDGNRFLKSDELRQDFAQSEAYSTLFMELCTNANSAAEFVNGIIPRGLEQEVEKIASDKPSLPKVLDAPQGNRGGDGPPVSPRALTMVEAVQMDREELSRKLASGEYVLDSSEG